MKKIIVITSFLIGLVTTPAFAKTQGNYIGLDLISTRTSFDSAKYSNIKIDNIYKIKDKNQTSASVNYKYAFNFNNIFVAPEIFFDYSHLKAKDAYNDTWNLNYRYGAKINLGYDITNQFAAYINAGILNNNYKVDLKSVSEKKSGNNVAGVYGVGIKYSVTNNIDFNLGYEISKLEVKDPYAIKTKFDVKVIRLGAAYKF